jgi:UDP-N-acetyl-D-mannosaminuronate dehydrogenase
MDVLVIGLGYVGLPLAIQAVRSGLRVTGYDTSEQIVAGLMAGRSHVDDISDADVAEMLAAGFRATTDEAAAGPQDVIVICVPTPLSEADGPDLSAVRAATGTAGRLLRSGTLVSLESTSYPGTTEEVVRPLLEKASGLTAGIGFSLAFSPERIDPGNPVYGFRNTPKIVGGHCIPIDPNYLSYKVRTLGYPFRFVELAQEINSRMPSYVTDRAAELLNRHAKPVNGAKVLLLGVTYKRDIADQRETPARPLARKLLSRGAQVSYHDPYVPDWQVDGQAVARRTDLDAALADADLVILLQAHQAYDPAHLAGAARLLLDTRGVVPDAPHVEAL